jgi:hypothetical protein
MKMFKYAAPLLALLPAAAHASFSDKPSEYAKNLGTCSFAAYNPSASNSADVTASLQNALLDCQLKAYALKDTGLDDQNERACMRFVFPRSSLRVTSPVVIPEHVCTDGHGFVVRTGQTGTVTAAYTGDTSSHALANLQQPAVIFPPHSHNIGNLSVYANSNGSDRGSGVFAGKNWVASAVTIQQAGTGYTAGDVLTFGTPSKAPLYPIQVTIDTVSSGVPQTYHVSSTGAYALPPILQQQQWTAANGFTGGIANAGVGKVFDPAHAGWYVTSGGTGTGAEFTATWVNDFAADGTDYKGGANIQADTLLGTIDVQGGSTATTKDATYGATFGVGLFGLNFFPASITTTGGYYGFWCDQASDIMGGIINPVGSAVGANILGCSSSRFQLVVDTPLSTYLKIDRSDGIKIWGQLFHNSNANTVTGDTIILGSDSSSSSSNRNTNIDLDLALDNAGAAGGIPAMSVANTTGSIFDLKITNLTKANAAASYLISSYAAVGSNVVNNLFKGSIASAAVEGPLFSGAVDPTNGTSVWSAAANGWSTTASNTVVGSIAPVSGRYYTSGLHSGLGTTNAPSTSINYIVTAIPYFQPAAAAPTNMALEVTTGSTTGTWQVDTCIYADSSGVPGALLLDVGATATGVKTVAQAATGVQIQAIPAGSLPGGQSVLQPGRYWLAEIASVPTAGTPIFKGSQTNTNTIRAAFGDALTQGGTSPSATGYVLHNTNAATVACPNPFGTATYGSAGVSAPTVWIGF